ncbi:hypothetical protein ACUNWD_20490 [Sunxiuqinia sp. A32]|uniref:hypothetical protein n=1 Tax=Sunxiuqinia sp. A32 TaxID=3461496 RepID=UPI004045DD72
MKNNVLVLAVTIGAFVFLSSCEHELTSENWQEIAPPDTTKMIQVELTPFETQYIFTVPTLVNYNLNTFGLDVYEVQFFVGDQLIYTGDEAIDYFVFEPSPWGISQQTMTMKVATNTNTGSIADQLGVEGFFFEQSWEVLLDGGNPDPVEITNIYNNDGILKIEWEEYERFNFQKYLLYKNFGESEWEGNGHLIAEVTDSSLNSWQDSSFIGGTGIYWIEVQGSNQTAVGQKKRFDSPLPKLDTLWVEGDSVAFKWTKNLFHKAVDHTTIGVSDYYPNPPITLYSSTDINDTTCVVSGLRFGQTSNYTLSVYPTTNIPIYQDNQILKSTVSFGIGSRLPEFSQFAGDPIEGNFYIAGNNGKIYRFSYPDIVSRDSCESGFFSSWFVSFHDQRLVTQINSSMKIYNKSDLNDYTSYECWDFGFHWFWNNFSISTNNRMVGPVGFGAGLYDWNSQELVFTDPNEELEGCSLSPDGQYAFRKKYLGYADQSVIQVWRAGASGMESMGELPANMYSHVSWMPDNGHQLMVLKGYEFNHAGSTGNQFGVYDAADLQVFNEFPVKVGYFSGADPESKLVAFCSKIPGSDYREFIYLYNFTTGNMEKRISLHPQINDLWLYRSHIFSSEGFCININSY